MDRYDIVAFIEGQMKYQFMSQRAMARKSNLTEAQVSRTLSRAQKPGYTTIVKMLDALGFELKITKKEN